LLLSVVPFRRIRNRRRQHLDEESRKCPRCLLEDTFEPSGASADDQQQAEAHQTGAPARGDHRQPRTRLMVCNACQYEIGENYLRQHRLCFPTVGIRSSGKTHWLAMLYRQIKTSNVQVASRIEKISSREDERFDELVREIVYNLGHPGPTIFLYLPYPLTFHVNDQDPLGKSRTMVNMFDFSGELTDFSIYGQTEQNEFRRRALLCEGFTLFLDPTQVTRGSVSIIDDQIDALAQFVQEMHAMRGIPEEQPIDLPIAVCVSKIDLLVKENPIGTAGQDLLDNLRATMGQVPSLGVIQQRSRLVARALPQMFPGWPVERKLRENFGGRYMFFPISSVGLDQVDEDDAAARPLAPFAILEPLLWLLHMHGYVVLRWR
jgi:hypothetical protein